ncbi:small RNA-binding protein 11, chloroplastic-like [Chenopodium quinoa]|uniref:small RNA-binding protein 11, chloroplastic-like n=1 Tax=Chenopodium quinoa TaxID=63459 RepID=UPI000B796FD2|nr:small RNA-binding protein 11, chloroplastic-like [Chenopodium quinoa]
MAVALIRRMTSNSVGNPNSLPYSLLSRRGIASRLFVGGLSFYTTEKTLAEAFSQYGQVIQAKIVHDRVSDRSKGFGFVTYASEDEADKALTEMNGKQVHGRVIFVDYAKQEAGFHREMPIVRGPPAS